MSSSLLAFSYMWNSVIENSVRYFFLCHTMCIVHYKKVKRYIFFVPQNHVMLFTNASARCFFDRVDVVVVSSSRLKQSKICCNVAVAETLTLTRCRIVADHKAKCHVFTYKIWSCIFIYFTYTCSTYSILSSAVGPL